MDLQAIMTQLASYGSEQTKKILLKHGAIEPLFGVKVADLKKVLKKTKKNHELSLQLYNTGNFDAMYLAGLMADEKRISKDQLQQWVEKADSTTHFEYTVPWITSETPYGFELGIAWIESPKEAIAAAGWSTLSNWASLRPNEELNLEQYNTLLNRVGETIHQAPNRVRYNMNGFVIAVGSYIPELTEKAKNIASKIGPVKVEMSGTACKVPLATTYIQKVIDKNRIGKKRKKARC